ncbi:hypothetical protein CERSUDRAFT_113922 [Gelatoporia subvermispora B]|uniref:Velvet domain-containing protein n=1 Tax=Ceriporiopsis subvermispora (strain B) TaxID=914234 RepID=M2QJQ7_CERS8|nr:hypothetical protein CERSUDRAFT_113922 [Gelatoporia subvermispora B]
MAAKASRVRATGSSALGAPVTFIAGPFDGRTIRAELIEIQSAELGRKYVHKDRRPLDPPPVVQLKLFEVFGESPGDVHEEALLHDEVTGFGFFCYIDLFPLLNNGNPPDSAQSSTPQRLQLMQPGPSSASTEYLPPIGQTFGPRGPPSTVDGFRHRAMLGDSSHDSTTFPSTLDTLELLPASSSTEPYTPAPKWQPVAIHNGQEVVFPAPPEVVAYYDDTPIMAASMCTDKLSGTSFRDSTSIDIDGESAIIFVFSDVSVRMEGTFVLRYRVFHIFSQAAGSRPRPVLAECFGEPFKVYSTKDFPGLHASTDLTKNLSIHGIQTNIRARERRRRIATHSTNSDAPPGKRPSVVIGGTQSSRGPSRHK